MICTCLGGFLLGGSNAAKCGDHRKKNFFVNNSVEALILLKESHQGLETACTFWGRGIPENCRNTLPLLAYSWLTSEECKILDAVVPDQLLAAHADTVAYQIEEYKISGLVVILHCLNGFQHNSYVAFSLLYVQLRENHKINAVCFPSFQNGCNPASKMWRRFRTGE